MRAAAEPGYPTATDLADWVVRVLKKPFREAHHIAGSIVKRAEEKGVTLDKLSLAEMQTIEPAITEEVFEVLSLEASVNSRMSLGGTAPARVKEQVRLWREKLEMKQSCSLIALCCRCWPASCGVKNDLVKPDGKHHAQGRARSLQAALSHRPLGPDTRPS